MSELHRLLAEEIFAARTTRAFGNAPDLARAWAERSDLDPEDLDHVVHAEQLSPLVPGEGLDVAESEFLIGLDSGELDEYDVDDGVPFELKF